MDREILFRGKAINRDNGYFRSNYKNGDWVYGLVTRLYDERFERLPAEMTDINGISGIEVDYKTIGQYTGLKDKNGKNIFEGDILKCHDNPKDLVKVVFDEFDVVDTDTECPVDTVIGWHYEVIPTDKLSTVEPFCLSMPLTNSYIKYCHMEVIGNIHDTP